MPNQNVKKNNPSSLSEESRSSSFKDQAFMELNAILLSIEWEITDEIMERFMAEIERLKHVYKNDKIIFSFLQLHGSVGKYIRAKRVTAHPDSINLLHSIHNGLNQVIDPSVVSESEKKKILSTEINRFKELKQRILVQQKDISEKNVPSTNLSPIEKTGTKSGLKQLPDVDNKKDADHALSPLSRDVLAFMLEEITKTIQSEFAAIREEIRQWDKNRS